MTNKLLTTSPIGKKSGGYSRKASRYGFTYNKSAGKPNRGSTGKSKKKVSLSDIKALKE